MCCYFVSWDKNNALLLHLPKQEHWHGVSLPNVGHTSQKREAKVRAGGAWTQASFCHWLIHFPPPPQIVHHPFETADTLGSLKVLIPSLREEKRDV